VVSIAFSHESGCDSHRYSAAHIVVVCGSGSPWTSTSAKRETP
jgi:hypothetical protein